jgi:hypothetical protein
MLVHCVSAPFTMKCCWCNAGTALAGKGVHTLPHKMPANYVEWMLTENQAQRRLAKLVGPDHPDVAYVQVLHSFQRSGLAAMFTTVVRHGLAC